MFLFKFSMHWSILGEVAGREWICSVRKNSRGLSRIPAVVSLLFFSFLGLADAQTAPVITAPFTTLNSFAGANGSNPKGTLVQGSDGNFYGTTYSGGSSNDGTVFKMTPGGALTTLYTFTGPNAYALGGVIQGSDGNFYGTTQLGGSSGDGTVFKITPSGTLTTICSFTGTNGEDPVEALIQGSDGNFYGTTFAGGSSNDGTVFKVTPSGTLTTLYSFSGTDGSSPYAGLVQGSDGNFYGTTYNGGSSGDGTVFKITPSGTLTTLCSFTGTSDGAYPQPGLIQGSDGNFYGTTSEGGSSDDGTVFKVTPGGSLTTLCSFTGTDGYYPSGRLIQGSDGNFYGTTYQGGSNGDGTVFEITPSGNLTTLYTFTGTNGSYPFGGLTQGSDGNFYGTTESGGSSNEGTVFKLTPPFATVTTGNAYSYQITATNSPTSYGASGLPAGLSVNTATGLISGTPTVPGTYNVTISASNAGGTGSASMTIIVQPLATIVGWWKFDEGSGTTAVDSSGLGNNGTYVGSPGWIAGVYGEALQLNGTSQYAQVNDSSSLDSGSNSLTLSGWFKAGATSAVMPIFSKELNSNGYYGFHLALNAAGEIEAKLGDTTGSSPLIFSTQNSFTDNQWHQVILEVNQSGQEAQIYVDGTAQALQLDTGSVGSGYGTQINFTGITSLNVTVSQPLNLGANPIASEYFNGTLDDLRVYKYVLSSSQMTSLINSAGNGLPDWWQIRYFGELGNNPAALAPNGSGLTILQCYQQGVNPQQAAPAEPFTIAISATGPFQSPANPVVVANVTHSSTTTITQVQYYNVSSGPASSGNLLGTTTTAPYTLQFSNLTSGIYPSQLYIIEAIATDSTGATRSATTEFNVTASNFYQRGLGLDDVYVSSVVGVGFEKGQYLDEEQGTDPNNNFTNIYPTAQYPLYPWFLRTLGETNELWQHIASVTILAVNNSTGVLTTTANVALHVGQKITIAGATGDTAINGTFLVGTVPAANQFTITTLSGGSVTLSGTYTASSGAITAATYNVLPTAANVVQGGEPPLVAFGSQGGGTPLYTNQSYNFGVVPGGQVVFAPITISSVTNSTGVLTTSTNHGLHVGEMIVISGATGDTVINGTFLVATVPAANQLTLSTATGGAFTPSGTYTANTGSITNADIKVEVYQASSFASGVKIAPVYVQAFTIPRASNTTAWSAFVANGYVQDYPISTTYGGNSISFDTQVQLVPGTVATQTWMQQVDYPLVVTHRAGNALFYYKVSYMGVTTTDDAAQGSYGTTVASASTDLPMAVDSTGVNQAYNISYTLDFTTPSSWQSTFINTPNFQGQPLPPSYQDQSVDELIHNAPQVSDTLSAPSSGTLTVTDPNTHNPVALDVAHVDNSPEVRDHTVLDNFVASMNNDPIALANYVLNQINLVDAVGYDSNTGQISDTSINPQGVSRDALATFLEGEGSPAEQDALLIYLLRKAGYNAAYVFPNQDSTLMFDQQLSNMLRMQIRGAEGPSGGENVPELIPVNYPWVAAYLPVNGTYKWVHIFPWIKDTVINEGNDLWGYLPTGYQTGSQWALHYVMNDPTIRTLMPTGGSITDDVNVLFPLYVQGQLAGSSTTMSQLGTTWYNRQNYYTSWDQFPRPWQAPTVTNNNVAMSLTASQNPSNFSTALTNIFDTVSIQVFSDRNDAAGNDTFQTGDPVINTGTMRLADIHDRRLLLYDQVTATTGTNAPTYNMVLSLEAFGDPNETNPNSTYTFNINNVNSNGNATYGGTANPDNGSGNPGDFMHAQIATAALQTTSSIATNDDTILYQINYNKHIQAQSIPNINNVNPWSTFLGVAEKLTISDTRFLRKGDMACLCLDYGQVSQPMVEYQAQKYWAYQQTVTAVPSTPVNPELAMGQLLFVMGDTFYNKIANLKQSVQSWTKTNNISWFEHGLSKLSPYRNSDGTPNLVETNTANGTYAVNLRYPRVDMAFQYTAAVGNGTTNLNSGDEGTLAVNNAGELITIGGSAYEHITVNQFFPQTAAISTIKLLDIAQGWTLATGTASHPGTGPLTLNSSNYTTQGSTNYTINGTTLTLSQWLGSIWPSIVSTLNPSTNSQASLSTVYVTPGPETAPGQAGEAYTGLGALTLGVGSYGAYITDNLFAADNGAFGGSLSYTTAPVISYGGDPTSGNTFTSNLDLGESGDASTFATTYLGSYTSTASSYVNSPITISTDNAGTVYASIGNSSLSVTNDVQNDYSVFANQVYIGTVPTIGATGSTTASVGLLSLTTGDMGGTSFYGANNSFLSAASTVVYDPVDSVTGEFYVNTADVRLNGPMPLEIRRIYGSLNQASNNFGYGWRMSYFPYLMVSNDVVYNTGNTQVTTLPSLIYAAEMDGSVIAYSIQGSGSSSYWIPLAAKNPNLANASNGKVGGAFNPFNNKITPLYTGSNVTGFTLTGADGSVRTFSVAAYPITGTTTITRTRPYLQKWTDNRGNYYNFAYGTTASAPDYGQLNSIQASNGNYLRFSYDTFGHIIKAYTGDGRILSYQYDTYGDLIQVTMPDSSTVQYNYQHASAAAVAGTAVAGNGTYTANSANISSDNGIQITGATNASPSVITTASAHGLQVGQVVTINGALGNTAINGTYTVGTVPSTTTLTLLKGATPAATYSTHLIVQETKPNGRILQNTYSSTGNYAARQVVTQSATVGTNQTPVLNASFNYGTPTKNPDGTYTGITIITDVNSNTTTYKYAESQITEIDYPVQNGSRTGQHSNGLKILQTWYTSTGSGGYQRSLYTTTDRRLLLTTYTYDAQGNILTVTAQGNLTGGSSTTETSATTMTYNSTSAVTLPGGGSAIPNTLASEVDQLGNGANYAYADSSHPYMPTTINKVATGGTVSTTLLTYGNVIGSTSAYGLLQKEVDASGTSDQAETDYTYNGNGFPTSKTQYSETNDPNVTHTYTYDLRGEVTSDTDAAGQTTKYSYDALGHQTGALRYDQWGDLVSWNYSYYNQNGDLMWQQGPRYNPTDETYYQYDGAGRLSQQVKTLSAALADGVGVTAAGYATTLYKYDNFGNLIEMDDPNQNATTMTYDADGEMLIHLVHSGAKTGAGLSSDTLTYEAGGKVATHKTMLGGTETLTYTYQGQVMSDAKPDGTTTSYLYDLTGRVVKQTLSNGSYWSTSYNDLNRIVTRTFYNSSGTQLMTESQTMDRRGNVISKTDVSGNTFTTTYDGLNRAKSVTGPPAAGSTAQQASFVVYDAAGQKQSATNANGERTDSYFDALGRPILMSVFNGSGTTASNTGFWYSPDHQSVVKTVGSGAANSSNPAVTTTTYTDTRGNPLILVHADGTFQGYAYDAEGNKVLAQDEQGNATSWTYDALDRVLSQTLPGGAATNFTYTLNFPGETVARAMPESQTAKTTYDLAGRETEEELDGVSSSVTRQYTNFIYYTSGNGAGRLESVTDPRGFTTTTTYDAWMRPSTVDSTGASVAQQNQNTTYGYDNRGMVNSVVQSYATAATGASTQVTRGYDAYGQMNAETTYLNSAGTTSFTSGNIVSQWAQSWDATGRRSALSFGLAAEGSGTGNYAYQYNANGLLTQVGIDHATFSYTYGDNDLLQQRILPLLTSTITQRDTRGRITAENVFGLNQTLLSESIQWRNDARLSNYTDSGPAVHAESRAYGYDARNRIASEPYYNPTALSQLSAGSQTALYGFDQASVGGANVLTGLGVRTEQKVNVNTGYVVTTQDSFQRPTADADQPGNGASGTINFGYDGVGDVTSRGITGGNTQTLIWDAYNRLVKVSQRNSGASDFDWTTVYDGLGRRVQTIYQPMNNGVNNGPAVPLTYYYDPQVEFLELGLLNGTRTWKVYGPDKSGVYGGAQGIGGIDGYIIETTGGIYSSINNFFGDSIGQTTSSGGGGFGEPLGGYGVLPGSGLSDIVPIWRSHYLDWTQFYYMGARYYDPLSGRFLSADPMGHDSSMSLYDYCNGDPVNGLDPDGRFGKGAIDGMEGNISSGDPNSGAFNLGFDVGNALGSTATGVNTLGDEMTGVAEYQGLKANYNSNYAYFGNSYDATVATLDPAYQAEAGFYEAGSGTGIQAGDSGETLSGWQRTGSGFEGVAGTVGTVGLAFGGAGLTSAVGSSLLADTAAEGVSVASGAGESASSTLVRNIGPNESFDDIAHELSQLTYETGNEHAYVVLGDGQSAIVSGGPGGINFSEGEVNAIVAHTHPIEAPSGLPSPADMNALQQLNQQNSMILYRGGQYEFGQ